MVCINVHCQHFLGFLIWVEQINENLLSKQSAAPKLSAGAYIVCMCN